MKKLIHLLVTVLASSQLFAQDAKPKTIEQLLKKLENFEVNADGSITVKEQSIDKAEFNSKAKAILCDLITVDDIIDTSKNNIVRLDCRDVMGIYNPALIPNNPAPGMAYIDKQDYFIQHITAQLPNTPAVIAARINEVDDYGDQVPHFSIKPAEGVYVSTSFERNVAEAVNKAPQ